jgi:squalene-hopene/tetraprenyl-beta-curcumene cyclase
MDVLLSRGLWAGSAESAQTSALEWLLSHQQTAPHPYNGAAPGGWSWSDRPGGIPSVEDTAGALLALARCRDGVSASLQRQIDAAVRKGLRWLLHLQNRDGGWGNFLRGWDYLPHDRSSSDTTAQALRALARCKACFVEPTSGKGLYSEIHSAIPRGIAYLEDHQREDGSWVPQWFGNQQNPDDENPVIGTSRVLIALADTGYESREIALRGSQWLLDAQHASGGWGPTVDRTNKFLRGGRRPDIDGPHEAHNLFHVGPSVEETSAATTALIRLGGSSPERQRAVEQGLAWLVEAVDNDRHLEPAPIGFHFARLWYYERLYPRICAAQALQVAATALSSMERIPSHHHAFPLQTTSF